MEGMLLEKINSSIRTVEELERMLENDEEYAAGAFRGDLLKLYRRQCEKAVEKTKKIKDELFILRDDPGIE